MPNGTTANSNTVVGYAAGSGITTGQQNSSLGLQSLNATTTGSNNTGLGLNALITNTTGSNNSALGSLADVGSAALSYATAIGAGSSVSTSNTIALGRAAGTDTVLIPGLTVQFEGAVLAISSNTITPTNSIHHVGAGLIKTITVPTNFTSGVLYVIPDAAFTYDATGNIVVPSGGGTAVVNKLMVFVYSSSASKWVPSY
ncbi:MAG: hypothetical protein ACXW18_00605 [Pyrinomonadaceae bacterium]